MSKVLEGLFYTKEHEWIKIDGNKAYVGITDYAQKSLGDIVFVDLPMIDDSFCVGDTLLVIESVKAASDVYAPISGTILEVNENLESEPELLNKDAYNNWLVVLEINDENELSDLLLAAEYETLIK